MSREEDVMLRAAAVLLGVALLLTLAEVPVLMAYCPELVWTVDEVEGFRTWYLSAVPFLFAVNIIPSYAVVIIVYRGKKR